MQGIIQYGLSCPIPVNNISPLSFAAKNFEFQRIVKFNYMQIPNGQGGGVSAALFPHDVIIFL